MPGGQLVDLHEWRQFNRQMRIAAPELPKALRLKLKEVGRLVAEKADEIISPASNTIPPSIAVRINVASLKVTVQAGDGVPLAGLFEEGNKGKRDAGGTFRHPVFGHMNVWVDQSTHPFLQPALEDRADEAERMGLEAVDETMSIFMERL